MSDHGINQNHKLNVITLSKNITFSEIHGYRFIYIYIYMNPSVLTLMAEGQNGKRMSLEEVQFLSSHSRNKREKEMVTIRMISP